MPMSTLITYSDPAEFARFFIEASEGKSLLCIRGFGTQGGKTGNRIIVSTKKLDSIQDESGGDLTLNVGSGVPCSRVKEILSPVSDSWPDYNGTVGGCICGDKNNPAYNYLISRVMSITIVRTNGSVIKLGSESVKDVAGYRIAPLFFGSQGKLGLITSIILNKAPIFRDYSPVNTNKNFSGSNKPAAEIDSIMQLFDPAGILR